MRAASENAEKLIEGFEGRRLVVYRDGGGVPTGGIGHTGRDLPAVGATVTDAQVEAWFKADLLEAEQTIAKHVPQDVLDAIPAVSYDALVSFVFNVGEQAFVDPKTGKQTNFSKTLNAKLFDQVDDRMGDWVYDNGRKINGLVSRRAAEAAQWNLGFEPSVAPAAAAPMAAAAAAASTATALPAEVTGMVPTAPPKTPALSGKAIAGVATSVLGVAASNAPTLIASGQQLRSMVGDIKVLSIAGAVLIALGTALVLWHNITAHRASGA
jgi:lysozyme